MYTEEKTILAFIFKRSGKHNLTTSEIYLPLSIELNWFTTKEAQQFVTYCKEQKLLTEKDSGFSPTFNIQKITIPLDFKPSKKYPIDHTPNTKHNKKISISTLLETISTQTKKPITTIKKEITQDMQKKNITLTTALVFYIYKKNIDISIDHEEIERFIIQENE